MYSRLISGTVNGISPGSSGGSWSALTGSGGAALVSRRLAVVTAQIAQGGHDQCQVPHDRGVQPDLGVVVAELVLPELVVFLDGPPAPADLTRMGRQTGRPSGTKHQK